MNYQKRVQELREKLIQKGIEQAVIRQEGNIYYYTGIKPGNPALLILGSEEELLIAAENDYNAEQEEYTGEVTTYRNYSLFQKPEKLGEGLARARERLSIFKGRNQKIGYDSEDLPLALLSGPGNLKDHQLLNINREIMLQRSIKDKDELEIIRQNTVILDEAMGEIDKALQKDSPIREIDLLNLSQQVIAERIGGTFVWEGCLGSGERTDNPDVLPKERVVKEQDLVLVDLFPLLRGYYGDITRTFVRGCPTAKQLELYAVLKGALQEGEKGLKPGEEAAAVDRNIRDFISGMGYGNYFNHHSGHGLGIDAPELPLLLPWSEDIICPGNIICIEPGIYLPGWGGMRIEQVYYISEDGPCPLSKYPFTI